MYIAPASLVLRHATAQRHLPAILADGLRAGSYWSASERLTAYYEETVADEDQVPVVLQVGLAALASEALQPDYPGIDEPICTVIGHSEAAVQVLWVAAARTWQDSLAIVQSVRYARPIPAALLQVVVDAHLVPLADYIRSH